MPAVVTIKKQYHKPTRQSCSRIRFFWHKKAANGKITGGDNAFNSFDSARRSAIDDMPSIRGRKRGEIFYDFSRTEIRKNRRFGQANSHFVTHRILVWKDGKTVGRRPRGS